MKQLSRLAAMSLAVVVTAVTVFMPAGFASAAPKPTPTHDDGQRVWSIRPADAHGAPDNRTHFTLQGNPGTTITDNVLITNQSKVPVTFSVYGTDAFNTPAGAFDLLSGDKKAVDLGSWIHFSSPTLMIAAGKSVAMPFHVDIPKTATPGDHAAGVVVSLGSLSQPGVHVDSRVAIRVYLRIPGNLRPRLEVDNVKVSYQGVTSPFGKGHVRATFTVVNPGNIRLQSHAKITLTGPFGTTLATVPPTDIPEILPGQSATLAADFPKVFPAGPITVRIALAPFPDPEQPVGQAVPGVRGNGYTWAVPWLLVGLILVIVAIVALLWWLSRRRMVKRLDEAMAVARDETMKSTAGVA